MSRPSIPPQDTVGSRPALRLGAGSLAHPLPSGMRDLLPAEAEAQAKLASEVQGVFELHGYQQVSVPAIEYADVLSQGLGSIEPHSMLRFVESETGEVVALRPDMTPQIARLVATRLAERPSPARISYEGSVLRRQHERARHDQQALQAGIELVGTGGSTSDLEVLTVIVCAVQKAGLGSFVLDLGHGGIAASLLEGVDEAHRSELLESLSLKDGAELQRRAELAGLKPEAQDALVALLSLQGGAEVFSAAEAKLRKSPAWPLVQELQELYERLVATGVVPNIVVDLGETSAVGYYTGPTFQILAEGPGRPVASGGRYDALYAHFGAPRPAAGGAIQLDHLRWALGSRLQDQGRRVVVTSKKGDGASDEGARKLVSHLRNAGISCIVASEKTALDYARAWRYSHIVRAEAEGGKYPVTVIRAEEALQVDPQSINNLPEFIRR